MFLLLSCSFSMSSFCSSDLYFQQLNAYVTFNFKCFSFEFNATDAKRVMK